MQSCDWWFDDDANRGLVAFRGGATLNSSQRMQAEDQEHKGSYIRFGRAVNPELDLEYQTGVFFDTAGIRPRPGCTKTLVDAAGFSGVCCRKK